MEWQVLVGVHEMGHQSCVCAQQFQRTKNHTAATLRFANSVHVTRGFNHGPDSRGPAREKSLHKHLHACTAASRVANRARDACSPGSLTRSGGR